MRFARLACPIVLTALLSACADDERNPFDPQADAVPPALTSLSVTEMENAVWVSWSASEPVRAVVEYDDPEGRMHSSYGGPRKSMAESGVTKLVAVRSGTSYDNLRVRLTDRVGNTATESVDGVDSFDTGTLDEEGLLFIAMIDVGWGDSFYLEAPDGTNCLIDAGHPQDGEVVRRFLLEDLGVTSLDFASMSHVHEDHVGGFYGDSFDGLDGLFVDETDNGVDPIFPVGTFLDILDKTPGTERNGPYRALEDALDDLGPNLGQHVLLETGASSEAGEAALEWGEGLRVDLLAAGRKPFLNPEHIYATEPGSVENNDSMIYRVQFGEFVMIFMGDGEFATEQFLQDRYPADFLRATVHKLGHHGSSDSNSERFLKIVDPVVGLVPNAVSENPGVEHPFVLRRLINLGADYYASDRVIANLDRAEPGVRGDVLLYTDGGAFTVIADNVRYE